MKGADGELSAFFYTGGLNMNIRTEKRASFYTEYLRKECLCKRSGIEIQQKIDAQLKKGNTPAEKVGPAVRIIEDDKSLAALSERMATRH